jgi:hypothetical protein
MDIAALFPMTPVPVEGTMLRHEEFGGMLAGGSLPILNLNHDAVVMWQLFDRKRTVAAIFALLAEEYNEADLRASLPDFVEFCINAGFLKLLPPEGIEET